MHKMLLIILVLFCSIFPQKAYAYIDPGTGSYILQMLIAAFLGGLYAIKLFWNNIKAFLENLFSRGKKGEEPEK